MLSTCESEEDEEELRDFVDWHLGMVLLECGCVDCCICDDSYKYYGDDTTEEEDYWE